MKPNRLMSLLQRIFRLDPACELITINRNKGKRKSLTVYFSSMEKFRDFVDTIELIVVHKEIHHGGPFVVMWDIDDLPVFPSVKDKSPFMFSHDEHQRARMEATRQEEDGAAMIGGKRHIGSGAIEDYKSDASSIIWQMESKGTNASSYSVNIPVLSKISEEANVQDKYPILQVRFNTIPDGISCENDWVMMPVSVFKKGVW